LSSLPPTLNKTYDSILQCIKQSHRELAKTALLWIAVAARPLLVEELIEACSVTLDDGGQVREESRLMPAQIVLLLRHLVVLGKRLDEYATDSSSNEACGRDELVFAHFSVMEYLTTPEYMAPEIRASFAIELKEAHLHVASSCAAYLLRTNVSSLSERPFPLRGYAWTFWSRHVVSSRKDFGNTGRTSLRLRMQESNLRWQVASSSGHESHGLPGDFERIVGWADSQHAVIDCLTHNLFQYPAP